MHSRTDFSPYDAIAMSEASLWVAVDKLVASLGVEALQALDVRAGEHLAAIITTCFIGVAPSGLDEAGGVDLDFTGSWEPPDALAAWISDRPAVFEVKSLPGPSRKFDSDTTRALQEGRELSELTLDVHFEPAKDILSRAEPMIARIDKQLGKKVGRSKAVGHGFLIIHPFDGLPAEGTHKAILGPSLASPLPRRNMNSLWIYWAPTFMTVWSSERRTWLNLVLAADDGRAFESGDEGLDVLQRVENYFLQKAEISEPSPFVFFLQSGRLT